MKRDSVRANLKLQRREMEIAGEPVDDQCVRLILCERGTTNSAGSGKLGWEALVFRLSAEYYIYYNLMSIIAGSGP